MADDVCIRNVDDMALFCMAFSSRCKEQLRDQFTVNVDWDLDGVWDDRCHGDDLLFNDDPLKIKFSVFDEFAIVETEGLGTFFLMPNQVKKLWETYDRTSSVSGYTVTSLNNLPTEIWQCNDHFYSRYALDAEFYKCYQETPNSSLNAAQRSTVERFFESLKTMFPNEFASTHEIFRLCSPKTTGTKL